VKPKRISVERHATDGERRLKFRASFGRTYGTAVCGPACTVVWQGRAGDRSPYADLCSASRQRHRLQSCQLSFFLVGIPDFSGVTL